MKQVLCNRSLRRTVSFALFLGIVVVAAGATPLGARSDDQPPTTPIHPPAPDKSAQLPGTEAIAQAHAEAVRSEQEREAELATPAFSNEREASRYAFMDLGSEEAAALLHNVFGGVLKTFNADPARYMTDAKLDQPLGNGDAVVTSQGRTALMEGSVPVQAKNDEGELEKVNLGLERIQDGFAPVNPLVEVHIGKKADEGIEVGSGGITVHQAGAERSSAGRPLGDKNIFFGEVIEGSDTDLLVSPISSGVEMSDMLRSADSPQTLRFPIEMPAGAHLRSVIGGGAEVVGEDGTPLAMVGKPTAVDAQGTAVPVQVEVEGNAVVLDVEHREGDYAYPILVDPTIENLYQDWGWWYSGQHLAGLSAWAWNSANSSGWMWPDYEDSSWPGWHGLFIYTASGNLPGNAWGQWSYSAPNSGTYLANAVINPFYRNNHTNCPQWKYGQPYDYDGMWNETSWNRILYNQANDQGWSQIESWGRAFIIGMGTSSGVSIPCWRDIGIGGVGIWLEDWQYPYLPSVGATPSGWVKKDGTPRTFSVTAEDAGLGVRQVEMFGVGTQHWQWNKGWCAGTYEQRCPNYEGGQITFTTNGFPYEGRYNGEGQERKFTVQVEDPTKKTWKLERPLWLDGTPPVVSLEGQLASVTEEEGSTEKAQNKGDDELSLPTYKLHISGDDGADRSGVKEIKVFLDEKQTPEEVKSVSCGTSGCAQTLTMDYTLRLPGLSAGEHSLRIVAVDKVGNESDPQRHIDFEYIPATGMKEEFVLQHFQLPDGTDYSGEAEFHGPEIAVNVINGNVVFHQRDLNVAADRAGLELERVYNSQLPAEKDGQWGHGWEISQAPEFEPEAGAGPADTATMTDRGEITPSVPVPQSEGQEAFSNRLRATVTTSAKGYEVQPADSEEVSVFNEGGRIEEVVLGDDEPVALEPRSEEELELMAPGPPTYVSALGSSGSGDGEFSHPAGMTIDAAGHIWVVDENNDRVQEFNAAGEYLSSFGSSGTGAGQFGRPTDVAIDSSGNLWVTDAGNSRVEKFDSSGEFVSQFGTYGTANGQFHNAETIAIDPSGKIWVGDTYNGRLQKFNSSGEFLQVIGSKGSGQGQMIEPTGIDFGPGGDVWVADWGNQRVSVFSESGEFVRQFGSAGSGDGQFARPDAIEVDTRGNVWVGDQNNDRIQEFDQEGQYVAQFGTTGSGDGQFNFGWPMGIASDSKGNLWVADTSNNRVQRWKVPSYVPSFKDAFGSSGSGDGQFSHPADVAVDSQGNLWIADKLNNRIQKFDSSGSFISKFGSGGSGAGQLGGPSSIAFDSAGNFWVAEQTNNRIQKFSPTGESLATVGAAGNGNGQFSGPEGIAIDANGDIWVSDTYNYRVQKFNLKGEFLEVVNPSGMGAIEPTGIDAGPEGNVWIADWSHNRVVAISEAGNLVHSFGSSGTGEGQFARPDAIDVDAEGNVWVGDQNNGRIQLFNEAGEYVTQFGGKGSGEGQFSFGYPFGIGTDDRGSIWIADANNNRIQHWKLTGGASGGEEAVQAPSFQLPAVNYEYSEGKLEGLQLEDEATEGEDPSVDLQLEDDLVSEAQSPEAGDTAYEYESDELTAVDSPEGQTEYGYDGQGRLASIELPNGTTATITYDGTSRATAVEVDPAGAEGPKTTHFSYQADPRRTTVWGGGNPETTYDIGEDGSVLKWHWDEAPPTITNISGSLWSEAGQELENKDRTLFVHGYSPHQIASIKVVVDGTSVVAETTCTDPAEPPSHVCDEPPPLEWITHPSEHAPGRMAVEVVVTDFLGHQTAERFFVIVPRQPPADPAAAERPNFRAIKLFREEYGLDRDSPRTEPEMNELALELLYEWEGGELAPMKAVAEFGVPMRAPELEEMEWREQYVSRAADAIPQWAEEHAPTTYGGFYVDDRAGGIIYVGFTGSSQSQAEQVEALKGSGVLINADQVKPYPIPPAHSVSDLEEMQAAIASTIANNSAVQEATVSLSLAEDGNVVEVGATNPSLVGSFLEQQFGANAPVVVVAESPFVPYYGRYNTRGPVYGGSAIVGANHHGCTAGFTTRSPSGPPQQGQQPYKYFVLTAGHCYAKHTEVGRYANPSAPTALAFGEVRRSAALPEFPGDLVTVDAEGILIDKSLRSHSVLAGSPLAPEAIQGQRAMKPRRWACWSGVTGGQHCGKVKKVRYQLESGTISWVFQVNAPSAEGDSGAPVWDPVTHKAVGVLSGGIPGGCWTLKSGAEMCPRTGVTPLLPRSTVTFPEGALPKMGLEVLRQR